MSKRRRRSIITEADLLENVEVAVTEEQQIDEAVATETTEQQPVMDIKATVKRLVKNNKLSDLQDMADTRGITIEGKETKAILAQAIAEHDANNVTEETVTEEVTTFDEFVDDQEVVTEVEEVAEEIEEVIDDEETIDADAIVNEPTILEEAQETELEAAFNIALDIIRMANKPMTERKLRGLVAQKARDIAFLTQSHVPADAVKAADKVMAHKVFDERAAQIALLAIDGPAIMTVSSVRIVLLAKRLGVDVANKTQAQLRDEIYELHLEAVKAPKPEQHKPAPKVPEQVASPQQPRRPIITEASKGASEASAHQFLFISGDDQIVRFKHNGVDCSYQFAHNAFIVGNKGTRISAEDLINRIFKFNTEESRKVVYALRGGIKMNRAKQGAASNASRKEKSSRTTSTQPKDYPRDLVIEGRTYKISNVWYLRYVKAHRGIVDKKAMLAAWTQFVKENS